MRLLVDDPEIGRSGVAGVLRSFGVADGVMAVAILLLVVELVLLAFRTRCFGAVLGTLGSLTASCFGFLALTAFWTSVGVLALFTLASSGKPARGFPEYFMDSILKRSRASEDCVLTPRLPEVVFHILCIELSATGVRSVALGKKVERPGFAVPDQVLFGWTTIVVESKSFIVSVGMIALEIGRLVDRAELWKASDVFCVTTSSFNGGCIISCMAISLLFVMIESGRRN